MKNLFALASLLLWLPLQAQDLLITGKVTDGQGAPLPGVNVVFKNTTTGTVTDAAGQYSLKPVAGNNNLIFSFVGLKTREIALDGRSTLDVSLASDDQLLEEVVVTAIGIESKTKALGYTVSEVKGKDLTNAREPNVVTALSGKVAGVQIANSGGSPGARLRSASGETRRCSATIPPCSSSTVCPWITPFKTFSATLPTSIRWLRPPTGPWTSTATT